MLELPEAQTAARQLTDVAVGKKIVRVVAGASPHKFAFFSREPEEYPGLLEGRTLKAADAFGGFVRLAAQDTALLFGDGVNLRWYAPHVAPPPKHQLLLELEDGSRLVGSVQMYGELWAYPAAEGLDNPYYQVAVEKPSPLSDGFTRDYFRRMAADSKQTLSAKAFLATEQRIPGLGNGVLQDILLLAGVHPKRKLGELDEAQLEKLYSTTVKALKKMTDEGGRNTEKDLLGNPGGYRTLLSAKSAGVPCPLCGKGTVAKQAYLGGSVYFCPVCQPL